MTNYKTERKRQGPDDPASAYNFYLFFYHTQQGIAQDLVYLLLTNVNLGAMILQMNIKANIYPWLW